MKRLLLFGLTVGLVTSCVSSRSRVIDATYSHSLMLPNQVLKVDVYQDDQKLGHSETINGGSSKAKSVLGFVMSESRHWRGSLVTYAPGVLIHFDGFNLNLSGQRAILNIRLRNGRSRQYECAITPQAFDKLMNDIGIDPQRVGRP